jgi:hypothetical protein
MSKLARANKAINKCLPKELDYDRNPTPAAARELAALRKRVIEAVIPYRKKILSKDPKADVSAMDDIIAGRF